MAMQYRPLKLGSTGAEVTMLQETLADLGYRIPEISGELDSGTRSAILAFQNDSGLPMTGEVDERTWQLITQMMPRIAPEINDDAPEPGRPIDREPPVVEIVPELEMIPGPSGVRPEVIPELEIIPEPVPVAPIERAQPLEERRPPAPTAQQPESTARLPIQMQPMPVPPPILRPPVARMPAPTLERPPVAPMPTLTLEQPSRTSVPLEEDLIQRMQQEPKPQQAEREEQRAEIPVPSQMNEMPQNSSAGIDILFQRHPVRFHPAPGSAPQRPAQSVMPGMEPASPAPTMPMPAIPAPEMPARPQIQWGSRGREAEELQRRLSELGYYTGVINGYFGFDTRTAVIQFQADRGLRADGIVDRNTWRALYEVGPVRPSPSFIRTDARGSEMSVSAMGEQAQAKESASSDF